MREHDEAASPDEASWAEIMSTVPEKSQLLDLLTPAERRVALHVRRGLSNGEIADALGKTESTIKKQVAACLRKLGVRNRLRLIAVLK